MTQQNIAYNWTLFTSLL